MSGPAQNLSIDNLPRVIPIFPLCGVLLLPRGRLPLNIFEPRYLQMVEDAMSSHRMIGMIQPANPVDGTLAPAVYPTGCIGRITSFEETPDSRFLITLTGVCRFDVARELPHDDLLYRRVYASYESYCGDLDAPGDFRVDRAQLVPALKNYFQVKGLTADWNAIDRAEDESLVTCLAMACPFDPREKQALLACENVAERSQVMQALLEMAVHDPCGDDGEHSVQ